MKAQSDEENSKIKKKKHQKKKQLQKYVELQKVDEWKSQQDEKYEENSQLKESKLLQKDEGYKKIKKLLQSQDDQNLALSSFVGRNKYRPFQVPPDFEQARLHGLAKKIGKISRYTKQLEAGKCCICCHLPYKKIPFKLGERIEKFASLGTAFTLFFYYNKQMVFLLFLTFLVGGLQNLIDTYNQCSTQKGCESFMGIIYSRDQNRSCAEDYFTQQLLTFITFWILFFSVIIFKIFQDGKDIQLKKKMPNHSDFTILVKSVQETNCEEEFKVFLENKILPDRKVDIVCINRVFKIQEYYELAQEKIKLVNKREKLKKKQVRLSEQCKRDFVKTNESLVLLDEDDGNNYNSNKQKLISNKQQKDKLKIIKKQYNEKKKKNEDLLSNNQKRMSYLENKYQDYSSEEIRTGMVFVTFNKYSDCQAVKDKYFKPGFKTNLMYKGKILKFRVALEPLDIIWENLETPVRVKLFRRSVFIFLALMLTFGSLVAVSAVTLWQKKILEEKEQQNQKQGKKLTEDIGQYALSLFCMIIIACINSLLTVILTLFSKYEKHNTFTSMSVSVSMRLSWIQFINTALVPFVILLILTPPEKKNDIINVDDNDSGQEYLQYVIQNIFFIFIGNAIFVPIITLYEPEFLWKKIHRWWILRKQSTCRKTQQQLNEIFEDPEFLIQEYYAIVNRIILSGFFYTTMLSLGILIKCITMGFLYWAFKYTFIHRSAYPKCLSNGLNTQMQQIMFFIPLIFTTGNLIYGKIFLKCYNSELFGTFNIIQLSFGLALIVFHGLFITFFERFRSKKHNFETYCFEKKVMGLSYEQANPITRAFSPESNQIELVPSKDFKSSEILNDFQESENSKLGKENSPEIVDGLTLNIRNIRQENLNNINRQSSNNQKQSLADGNSLKEKLKIDSIANFCLSPEANGQATNHLTQTSIIDYAFTNILLRRERENQIISAAFERKKTLLIRQASFDQDRNESRENVEEDEDDDEEDQDALYQNSSF